MCTLSNARVCAVGVALLIAAAQLLDGAQAAAFGGAAATAKRLATTTTTTTAQPQRAPTTSEAPFDIHEDCHQPRETGRCFALFHRFAFNVEKRACEKFIYGGCGGNQNNFESLEECERVCRVYASADGVTAAAEQPPASSSAAATATTDAAVPATLQPAADGGDGDSAVNITEAAAASAEIAAADGAKAVAPRSGGVE